MAYDLNTENGSMASPLIPIGAGLAQGIGQGLFGQAQAKADAKNQKAATQLTQGQQAMQVQHELDSAPLRDRAMYLLQQRLGQTPAQFKPHDLYNQSTSAATPQYGGYDQAAMQRAQQMYQPGMGNVNTAVGDHYINKLGYGETTTNPLGTATGQPTVYGGDFAKAKATEMAADHGETADPRQRALARIRQIMGG